MIMSKMKIAPFLASLALFSATTLYHGGVDLSSAFAQSSWCGQYDGGHCGDQTYCKVPGGLTGCLQWGIRPVYHPKTIKQCTVPGTNTGEDLQTDPSGDCVN
jgi:hypothetical protein